MDIYKLYIHYCPNTNMQAEIKSKIPTFIKLEI